MAPFRIKRMTNAELVELAGEQGPLPMMDKFFAQPAVTKITRDDLDRKMSVHKYTLGDVLRDNEKAFKEIRRKEAALKEVRSCWVALVVRVHHSCERDRRCSPWRKSCERTSRQAVWT